MQRVNVPWVVGVAPDPETATKNVGARGHPDDTGNIGTVFMAVRFFAARYATPPK